MHHESNLVDRMILSSSIVGQLGKRDEERLGFGRRGALGALLRAARKDFERRNGRCWWIEPRRLNRARVQRLNARRNRRRKGRRSCAHAHQCPQAVE